VLAASDSDGGNTLYSVPNCAKYSKLKALSVYQTGRVMTVPMYGITSRINPMQQVMKPAKITPITKPTIRTKTNRPKRMKGKGCLLKMERKRPHAFVAVRLSLYMRGTTKLSRKIEIYPVIMIVRRKRNIHPTMKRIRGPVKRSLIRRADAAVKKMIPIRMKNAKTISPKQNRQTKREFPSSVCDRKTYHLSSCLSPFILYYALNK